MTVGLCKELHATGLRHLLQLCDHLGCMVLQLLDARTRQREGHLEEVAILLNHVVQDVQRRHIAAVGDVGDATLVLVVIVVIMVGTDIEETVTLQMNNLMYLEI